LREGNQLFQSAARARTRWIRDGWAESKQARVERPPVEETEEAGLRGLANVAMVQAADFRELYDLARRGELDRPEVWSILVEREMGTRPMVVAEVTRRRCRSPRTRT
jgi:hypothetical protein